jgi:Protein of unknown function (DUF1838)
VHLPWGSIEAMRLNPSESNRNANLEAFVKMRASLEPHDVVVWLIGNIYAYVAGEPHRHLFSFEGHSVGRAERIREGFQWLSREAMLYQDVETGEILEHWANPYTGEVNEVVHVWNDPVNRVWMTDDPSGLFPPKLQTHNDRVTFCHDEFLLYPNPLPLAEYGREVGSAVYQGVELMELSSSKNDVESDRQTVPCDISWVRITPYVPWMLMGNRSGHLVYHLRGHKLSDGYAGLPKHLRAYVEANRPEYAFAPRHVVSPNETPWTLYAKERGPYNR